MEIQEILELIGEELSGKNAIVQIQVAGKNYIKVIGDANKVMAGESEVVESNVDFYDWVGKEIEKQPVCEGTKLNHRAWLNAMKSFRSQLYIKGLTYKLICEFEFFLREQGYKINTIGKEMKILKKYVNILIDNDMIDKSPFRKYKIKAEETHKNALTEREIKKIEKGIETLTDNEQRVMIPFLFSTFSGLRYSDIKRITSANIKSINRNKWIVLRMKKTDHEVRVPISKMFGGKGMKYIHGKAGKLFDLPNNSETNVILSRVLRKLHIRKHCSFHCARVTTATTLLYKGVNLTTIQHILGHVSIKTTQVYAKCEDKTIYKDVKKAFKMYA